VNAPTACLVALVVAAVLVIVAVQQGWRADTMRGPWSVHTGGPGHSDARARIARACTARCRAASALAVLLALAAVVIGCSS
jgi:hypothetical protein